MKFDVYTDGTLLASDVNLALALYYKVTMLDKKITFKRA